jgi:hypothetical protein
MSTEHACLYCTRQYKLISSLQKHSVICKFMNDLKTKTPEDLMDSAYPTPNTKMLFAYIQLLNEQVAKLTDEVQLLKQKTTAKNQTKVETWLNTHRRTVPIAFCNWYKEKAFSPHYLDLLYENDMTHIIKTFIDDLKTSASNRPISVFSHNSKQVCVYIFDCVSEFSPSKWRKINVGDLQKVIKYVMSKVLGSFIEWKNDFALELDIKKDAELKNRELVYMTKLSKANTLAEGNGTFAKNQFINVFVEPATNMYDLIE